MIILDRIISIVCSPLALRKEVRSTTVEDDSQRSPSLPLSSSSKLSESNVGIPYTSKQTMPKP